MILLCGGTGLLGGRIAARLSARGVAFRALVRPTSDASPLERLGAEIVRGDFRERESLDRAVAGVDTVITTVTSMSRLLAGVEKTRLGDVDDRGTANLIDAAEQAGVSRFVYVSAAGVQVDPRMPLARAKLANEARLRGSGLREVIVRPAAFQEVWLTEEVQLDWRNGKAVIFGKGETKTPYVSADDVAEATVRWALADDPPAEVDFGGPESLTRKEVVELLERATGKPIKVRHVPRAALRIGKRALAGVRPATASVMAISLILDEGDPRVDDAPLRAIGIEPKPGSQYLAEAVGRG